METEGLLHAEDLGVVETRANKMREEREKRFRERGEGAAGGARRGRVRRDSRGLVEVLERLREQEERQHEPIDAAQDPLVLLRALNWGRVKMTLSACVGAVGR